MIFVAQFLCFSPLMASRGSHPIVKPNPMNDKTVSMCVFEASNSVFTLLKTCLLATSYYLLFISYYRSVYPSPSTGAGVLGLVWHKTSRCHSPLQCTTTAGRDRTSRRVGGTDSEKKGGNWEDFRNVSSQTCGRKREQ